MDRWIVGVKYGKQESDTLLLIHHTHTPRPVEAGQVIYACNGSVMGQVTPVLWTMRGGQMLTEPISVTDFCSASDDQTPDWHQVAPYLLNRRHVHC